MRAVWLLLPLLWWAAAARECPVEGNLVSRRGGGQKSVVFANRLPADVFVFWIDWSNQEAPNGVIGAYSDMMQNSYDGHAFRIRTATGVLLLEYTVGRHPSGHVVEVTPCGAEGHGDIPLFEAGRDAEFAALAAHHASPCSPPEDSSQWSCVRRLTYKEALDRNASEYGFQPGEVPPARLGDTYDKTYTQQIPRIPKVTPGGAGYLKMNMTARLKDLLLDWYEARKEDAMIPHDVIPGGYTNNDLVQFHKIDLDRFPSVHSAIVREMQQVLQWWTRLRLKHTSTFGVRIYRRHSMLIDHVDRMDTHLASAVLQVAQHVDNGDGGWPLEVLLPDGNVGEVFLQPGEMVLYEGAWLRHGRPKRFKGDEFANIFTHFAPVDWRGPSRSAENPYYGYVRGRCDTLADKEDPRSGCTVSDFYKRNEVELDFGVDLPAAEPLQGVAATVASHGEL